MYTLPPAPLSPSCSAPVLVRELGFYMRFSTCNVYGIGLGHVYSSADWTSCPLVLGPGAGAALIFLYKLSENRTD